MKLRMRLTFFTKPDCELCDAAWFVVDRAARHYGVEVERVDISATGQEIWFEQYKEHIPVVHLDGREIFRHRVDDRELRRILKPEAPG